MKLLTMGCWLLLAAGWSAVAPARAPGNASTGVPLAKQAPGAAPGLVWVDTAAHLYYCPSAKWYGRTRRGLYMVETSAIADGNHAEGGKACR